MAMALMLALALAPAHAWAEGGAQPGEAAQPGGAGQSGGPGPSEGGALFDPEAAPYAETLAVGGSRDFTSGAPGPIYAWFTFTTGAPGEYTIEIEGMHPELALCDASGSRLKAECRGNRTEFYSAGGVTYYLRLNSEDVRAGREEDPAYTGSFDYTVSLSREGGSGRALSMGGPSARGCRPAVAGKPLRHARGLGL